MSKHDFNRTARECAQASRDAYGIAHVLAEIVSGTIGPHSPEALTAAALCGRIRRVNAAAEAIGAECYSMQYVKKAEKGA